MAVQDLSNEELTVLRDEINEKIEGFQTTIEEYESHISQYTDIVQKIDDELETRSETTEHEVPLTQ